MWQVIIARKAERTLKRLPRDVVQRLSAAIDALSADPRPEGSRKLAGFDNLYRVRVGGWRIIYTIEDDRLLVLVLTVAPRGGAYKNL